MLLRLSVLLAIATRAAAATDSYAGSKSCLPCHKAIYDNYVRTPMGRSIGTPDAALLQSPPGGTIGGKVNAGPFRVVAEGAELFQLDSRFQTRHKLEYAIGSGENGISFIVRRGNHLFQAPVSYYSASKTWELSPGFEQTGAGFDRPIYQECIVCHAGRARAVPHRDGLYETPPFEEAAIGCENCHGPGAVHIKQRSAASIVNPRRLPARLAEDICLQCHQGGDARVLLPGKHYGDFRPGKPLIETLAVVALTEAKDADLLEHHDSMKLSACYRASNGKLGCLTCHNPHQRPDLASFRKACLSCHVDCKLDRTARQVSGDNCAGCHMPKRPVGVISHSALTNHRIPVRPGTAAAPSFRSSPDMPGLRLVDGNESTRLPLVTQLSAYGELLTRAPGLNERYRVLLKEASQKAPQDPVVLAALAHQAFLEKRPDAADLLRKAIDGGAPGLVLHLDLVRTLEDPVAALEKAGQLFPFSQEVRKRLALGYIRQKEYLKAQSTIERYVADFPEDEFMRDLLRKIPKGPRP